MNTLKFRITGKQYSKILEHVKTDDGKAVTVGYSGVGNYCDNTIDSTVICLQNNFEFFQNVKDISDIRETLSSMAKKQKNNSIPTIIRAFRPVNVDELNYLNELDKELFVLLSSNSQSEILGLSVTINDDEQIKATAIFSDGRSLQVNSVAVAGSNFDIWYADGYRDIDTHQISEFEIRTAQAFGKKTTLLLSKLSVGIVGISGTGSPLTEMLYRLGVGELVLVDSDIIEEKNIGRIYNSTKYDAEQKRLKVSVLQDAINRSGVNTIVTALPYDLFEYKVVKRLSQCDVIFGCMDSVDGRNLLNRLCVCYLIPYIDLGVKLNADGKGGVDQVCGTVHYLQPDGSSLLGRGVYTLERLKAEALKRASPQEYQKQIREKYITGVVEERPAVISVNTMTASLAVNDLLARIHPYRDESNSEYESFFISLTQMRIESIPESPPCKILSKYVGRADMKPLLDMPSLSERREMLV